MKRKKIIISCGGTGGHIFPAIEIAKSLKLKNPNIDILFVGALSKMEMVVGIIYKELSMMWMEIPIRLLR